MGGIIGTSVSAGFLVVLGVLNGVVLWKLVKLVRVRIGMGSGGRGGEGEEEGGFEMNFKGAGCLFWVLKRVFRVVDRWVFVVSLFSFFEGGCCCCCCCCCGWGKERKGLTSVTARDLGHGRCTPSV